MIPFVYVYHGFHDVYLPTIGIVAKGNDLDTHYYTWMPIHHPDFEEISSRLNWEGENI